METPEAYLRRAARDHADRPAARCGEQQVSYRSLYGQAEELAARLRPHLDGENRRVALVAPNSLDYLIHYWAILLAGGTTVELSPLLGVDERKLRLAEAQPRLLLPDFEDRGRGELTASDPLSIASVVFTSGTTGEVKGVLLSRANLAWVTPRIAASFGLQRTAHDECFSAFLPFCHTYGKSVVHLAAWMGASLWLDQAPPTPARMVAQLKMGVTHLSLVPFQVRLLLAQERFSSSELPQLRRLTVAGGALAGPTLERLMDRFPGRVQVMYGLTEASTRVTCMPADELASHPGSCGKALRDVELKIGQHGEVLVRGGNVMQGYLGEPQAGFQDGWLLTGDIGSIDASGYLTIEGRRKNMIKTLGESVNPLTVERALETFPGVEAAAVRGVADPERGEAIEAFVVGDTGLEISKMQAHCAALLGRARVPLRIAFVDSLPRGPSGKLRRHLLD